MRKLLRDRCGTVAFAIVVAAIPLIGAVGLGAEASSWYVTKQHAQNAADTAAYSGALKRACELGTTVACNDAQSVEVRGKQFATQNGFCEGCTLGDATQHVTINIGNYDPAANPPWTTNASGSFVQAVVTQKQPVYLAAVLNLTTGCAVAGGRTCVNIGATAIARVQTLANPCALALTGSISFQGNPDIDTPNCGIASNSTAKNAIDFTGGVHNFHPGSLSAAGGCTENGNSAYCKTALTYSPPVTNPFAALDKLGSVTLPNGNKVFTQADLGLSTNSKDCPNALTAYSAATPCLNDNVSLNSATALNGVYFISGNLQIKGTSHSLTGNALFILLNGSTFSFTGNSNVTVTGLASVASTQLPLKLQPYAHPTCTNNCLFDNMAIYDQTSAAVTLGGTSNLNFSGSLYFPNSAVTFQGNPTIASKNCGEIIAASLSFNGHATFIDTGCANSGTPTPTSQYVALVQ